MSEKQETIIAFALPFVFPIMGALIFLLPSPLNTMLLYVYFACAGVGMVFVFHAIFIEGTYDDDGKWDGALLCKERWWAFQDWWWNATLKKEKVDPASLLYSEGWQDIMEGVDRLIPERRKIKNYKPIKKMYLPSQDGVGLYARNKEGKPVAFGVKVAGKHFSVNDFEA